MPLGLACMVAVLRSNNIECDVIDPIANRLSKQELVKRAINYDIVGLSVLTPQRFEAVDLVKSVKKKNPNVTIVVGGPHVTHIDTIWMEKVPETDIAVRGEGEYPFLQIVKGTPLKEINNITFREEKKIIRNSTLSYVKNLDSLPFLAYDKFPLEKYAYLSDVPDRTQIKRQVGMITSRGCSNRCLFCSAPGQFGWFWRGQSPKRVVDEIEYVIKKFGVDYIRFFDDHFTFNKKRTIEICQEIKKRNLDIRWRCETRVDFFDEELAKIMFESGCHEVEFGVESGSQRIIDTLGKKITISQIKKSILLCRKNRISPKGFFIVGLPGETFHDVLLTARIMNLFDDCCFGRLAILPGSRLWSEMKQTNKWNDDWWFDQERPKIVYCDEVWNKTKTLEWKFLLALSKFSLIFPNGKWVGPKYFARDWTKVFRA
jgi:radical SAM superfamily enzyme YgiQ (UPF0313 family)